MKRASILSGICLVGLLAGAGCPGELYRNTNGGYLGARISSKPSWIATGSLANPPYATDGNIETAAMSDYQYAGAEITIDLRETCEFQSVVLDHGKNEMGFARKLSVSTSVDGNVFLDRYVGPDTRRVSVLSMPGPVLARYVRIRVVIPGAQPWSVAEVYLQ